MLTLAPTTDRHDAASPVDEVARPLQPEDYRRFASFFSGQPHELCEYCLATIIVWANDEYRPHALVRDNALVIVSHFTSRRELDHCILPVAGGRWFPPEYLAELADSLGIASFWFVPETYVDRFGPQRIAPLFEMSEQSAYTDYIYRASDLARLPGNRYAKKRNLINQFLRQYAGRYTFERIDARSAPDCLAFLEEWCATRQCDEGLEDSLTCERLAAEKMLNHIEWFDSEGYCLRIDGKVHAFGVASPLTSEMAVLQFEKAFDQIKGLYQFFDRECARRLVDRFSYINKESDMEVPGLARAKRSYHPIRRLRSFQLRRRTMRR